MKRLLIILIAILALVSIPHLLFSYRSYNVLLITIDTLRADFLSIYNSNTPPTPHIDSIAEKGVRFTDAYSLIPITLPAHTSMFSSRAPHEVSVFNNGDIVGNQFQTLAEILHARGYATGGFVSLAVLKSAFGISRGFQTYSDEFGKERWYRFASEINDAFLPWLEKNRDNRFFAWVHYSDPHDPYVQIDAQPDTEVVINGRTARRICLAKKERIHIPWQAQPGENEIRFRLLKSPDSENIRYFDRIGVRPHSAFDIAYDRGWKEQARPKGGVRRYMEDEATVTVVNQSQTTQRATLQLRGDVEQTLQTVRRNYAAEVQYTDRHVGQILERLNKLNLSDKTIVIVTSDHGEGLGDHIRIGHLYPLYREITRVPLIVYYPRLGWGGKQVDELVNHLDIQPTILDLLHIKQESGMKGRSLKRYLTWSPLDFLFAQPAKRASTFLYTFTPQAQSNSFALIQRQWKLIQTRKPSGWNWEAYDLSEDPGERTNLVVADPERYQKEIVPLRPILDEWSAEAESAHRGYKNPDLNEEQKRMLRDLGYIAP